MHEIKQHRYFGGQNSWKFAHGMRCGQIIMLFDVSRKLQGKFRFERPWPADYTSHVNAFPSDLNTAGLIRIG